MKAENRTWGFLPRAILLVGAVAALFVWPAWAHHRWVQGGFPLHGVPALLLGGLLWIGILGGVGFIAGGRREGWRGWLIRGAPRWLGSVLVLGASFVAVFYAFEAWRGRRAWGRVTALAASAGESLDPRSLAPPAVPASEDLWQAPLFEAVRRAALDGSSRRADPDLGVLGPLLGWENRAGRSDAVGFPGWMTGQPEPLRETSSRHRQPRGGVPRASEVGPRDAASTTNDPALDGGAAARRRQALDFMTSIEGLEPLLAQVRDVAVRRHCRVPLEPAFALLDDRLADRSFVGLERLAFRRARALLELDRKDEAIADLRLGFELARHARDLPGVYGGQRTLALAHEGMQALWEGLAQGAWNAEQVASLETWLSAQQRSPEAEVRRRLRWVALGAAGFVESLVPTAPEPGPGSGAAAETPAWATTPEDREVLAWVRRLYPTGWSLQCQASVLEAWLRWGAVWRWRKDGTPPAELGVTLRSTSDPVYPVFVLPKVRQLWEDALLFAQLESACWQLAVGACAVERQRLRSGALPEAFGTEAPVPENSEAGVLHYRRVDERTYRLYHEGLNARDDGGLELTAPAGAEIADSLVRAPDWGWTGRVPGK